MFSLIEGSRQNLWVSRTAPGCLTLYPFEQPFNDLNILRHNSTFELFKNFPAKPIAKAQGCFKYVQWLRSVNASNQCLCETDMYRMDGVIVFVDTPRVVVYG
jgi:hypothetical protein